MIKLWHHSVSHINETKVKAHHNELKLIWNYPTYKDIIFVGKFIKNNERIIEIYKHN